MRARAPRCVLGRVQQRRGELGRLDDHGRALRVVDGQGHHFRLHVAGDVRAGRGWPELWGASSWAFRTSAAVAFSIATDCAAWAASEPFKSPSVTCLGETTQQHQPVNQVTRIFIVRYLFECCVIHRPGKILLQKLRHAKTPSSSLELRVSIATELPPLLPSGAGLLLLLCPLLAWWCPRVDT